MASPRPPEEPAATERALWLDARSAAESLGVKRETLYAYASRGLVQTTTAAGGRERRYLRADVERLVARRDARRGHAPVAAAALRWGDPILDSALTDINARGPRYRGHEAIAMAEAGVGFETVAELLWTGWLPPKRPRFPGPQGREIAAIRFRGMASRRARDTMLVTLAAAAAAEPEDGPPRLEDEIARARFLVRSLVAAVAATRSAGHVLRAARAPTIASGLLTAFGVSPSPKAERALDTALILCADHELNASAFAARVAASTGAGLAACLTAALATRSGARHGGASRRVEAFLAEIRRARSVARALGTWHSRGHAIPGFGHPLYPAGDPRARHLLSLLAGPGGRPRGLAAQVVEAMAQRGEHPNLDLGLVALSGALGLPEASAYVLFAVGRSAGWAAHVLEQRMQGFLLRPRARYVGPLSAGGPPEGDAGA